MIILSKLPPDHAPFIDSIMVGAMVFTPDTVMPTYSARTLDTLRLRVFARDTDTATQCMSTWTKKNAKDSLVRTPGSPAMATMVFDTTFRKSTDTLRAVDTITVSVKDSRGDSARTVVRIVQGHLDAHEARQHQGERRHAVQGGDGSGQPTPSGQDTLFSGSSPPTRIRATP